MGHNKNYSNYSKQNKVNEVVNNEEVNEVVNNEEVNEIVQPEPVFGFVDGCERLNMRKEASKESDVITILTKNTEVEINESESTEEFYKVNMTSGVEGFCMRKFISIK